jgi:hypothetical protein
MVHKFKFPSSFEKTMMGTRKRERERGEKGAEECKSNSRKMRERILSGYATPEI